MQIGIIVYSQSGHTLLVAESLAKRLFANGHKTTIERLPTSASQNRPSHQHGELKTKAIIDQYDALIVASPVIGGKPAQPIEMYLGQMPNLEGKKLACFVTGLFPEAWGSRQSLEQIRQICESKNADILGSASVRCFGFGRKKRIADLLEKVSGLFA